MSKKVDEICEANLINPYAPSYPSPLGASRSQIENCDEGAFFLRPKLKAIVLCVRVFILPYPIKNKNPAYT